MMTIRREKLLKILNLKDRKNFEAIIEHGVSQPMFSHLPPHIVLHEKISPYLFEPIVTEFSVSCAAGHILYLADRGSQQRKMQL